MAVGELGPMRRGPAARCALALLTLATGCDHAGAYTPRTREITITTVPLLVRESQAVYPFLEDAFAPGGVLDGKEVYAFSPSTIVAVEGDTLHLTLINPEDDLHSFVLPGFVVALPGGQRVDTTYVARQVGIHAFYCNVASHLPTMWGQLVVLPAAAMAGVGSPGTP